MTEQKYENPKAYRWHMYWLVLCGLILFGGFAMYGVVQFAGIEQGDFILEVVMPGLFAPLLFAFLPVHFLTLFAYHTDAKYLKKSDAEYSPRWGIWVLGHLIYSPVVVPLYLYRRRRKVGNDYDGTRAGRILGLLNPRSG